MNLLNYALLLLSLLSFSQLYAASRTARECTKAEVGRLLQDPSKDGKKDFKLNCSVELSKKDIVKKRILLEGDSSSGVKLMCNGATLSGEGRPQAILITSLKSSNETWDRPENIMISDCRIFGSIRISGMGPNGEAEEVRKSSLTLGHSKRAREAAPQKINLQRLHITAQSGIPLYISPGSSFVRLENSVIDGNTQSTNIYLDAESSHNVIRNNKIHAKTSKRELIAVDGSADNIIVDNEFSSLENGGIFVYRNCGEGGTVRHQKPQHNLISNNFFYYDKFDGDRYVWTYSFKKIFGIEVKIPKYEKIVIPSVWLGSRNGNRSYCELDKGYDFGSSATNQDFAFNNIVIGNQIKKLSPQKMIVNVKDNIVRDNTTVDSYLKRNSICYKKNGYPDVVLKDNEKQTKILTADGVVKKSDFTFYCDDGEVKLFKI